MNVSRQPISNSPLRLFVFAVVLVPLSIAPASDTAGDLAALEEEWNRRVATMITGEITYVEFHHAYEFPPKTRADVTAALRRINSDMPCESIREFACDLMNRIVPEDPPVWPRQRFLFKGDKTRDERTGGLEIFDGSDITVAAEHANFRQITIGARSGTVAPQLHGKHSFFWFPQALGDDDHSFVLKEVRAEAGEVELTRSFTLGGESYWETAVAVRNGDVVRRALITEAGAVVDELLQTGWHDHDPGVRIPSLILATRYDEKGLLVACTIRCICSAVLNIPIADENFVVGAERGDAIVDYSSGGKKVTAVKESIDDVVASSVTSDKVARMLSHSGGAQGGSLWATKSFLVFVNALFLVLFVAFSVIKKYIRT